jgi:putative transposase
MSKHKGEDQEILNKRVLVYKLAKQKNPNRWSKETRDWSVIEKVELNPKKNEENLAA